MSEMLSFLGGETPSEVEVTPEVPAEAAPAAEAAPETPASGPERGPDGKFQAKGTEAPPEAQTPPEPETPPQAPLTEKETVGFYKAMAEERDKRQALERQLAELKARAEPESVEPLPPAPYTRAELSLSRKMAVKEYGAETVDAAFAWANARCDPASPDFDPGFNSQVAQSGDPYETAVAAFNRDQIVAEVKSPDDLAEYRAWKAAQAAAPTPPQPAAAPPRSLATASGTGAVGRDHVPIGDGQAFAAVIPN